MVWVGEWVFGRPEMRVGIGREPTTDNKSVAACGRLTSASEPTGPERSEPVSSISIGSGDSLETGWLRAGSATAGTLSEMTLA